MDNLNIFNSKTMWISVTLYIYLYSNIMNIGICQFHTKDKYLNAIDRAGRYMWLPFVEELMTEYYTYTGLTEKLDTNLLCPVVIHRNTNSTVEVESWCGDIDGQISKDIEATFNYINFWISGRYAFKDINIYCQADVNQGDGSGMTTRLNIQPNWSANIGSGRGERRIATSVKTAAVRRDQ